MKLPTYGGFHPTVTAAGPQADSIRRLSAPPRPPTSIPRMWSTNGPRSRRPRRAVAQARAEGTARASPRVADGIPASLLVSASAPGAWCVPLPVLKRPLETGASGGNATLADVPGGGLGSCERPAGASRDDLVCDVLWDAAVCDGGQRYLRGASTTHAAPADQPGETIARTSVASRPRVSHPLRPGGARTEPPGAAMRAPGTPAGAAAIDAFAVPIIALFLGSITPTVGATAL
jgi:hypothetical protein